MDEERTFGEDGFDSTSPDAGMYTEIPDAGADAEVSDAGADVPDAGAELKAPWETSESVESVFGAAPEQDPPSAETEEEVLTESAFGQEQEEPKPAGDRPDTEAPEAGAEAAQHDFDDDEPQFDTQTGERLDKPKKKYPGVLLTLAVTAVAIGCFVYAILPGGLPQRQKDGAASTGETEQATLAIADVQTEAAETEQAAASVQTEAHPVVPETVAETETEMAAETETETETEAEPATPQTIAGLPDFRSEAVTLSASLDVSGMVEDVMPSVVSITSTSVQTVQDFFYGRRQIESTAAGSGFIVYEEEDSYGIVTDSSTLAAAQEVTVGFYLPGAERASGEDLAQEGLARAALLGMDPDTGLALLQVDRADVSEQVQEAVHPAVLGDSDAVRVGERAIAIGNALGYGLSVTEGIISAVGRELRTGSGTHAFLQTDASINYGNYGGALLNEAGEVIGINAGKVSGASSEGMGFAFPINDAKQVITELSGAAEPVWTVPEQAGDAQEETAAQETRNAQTEGLSAQTGQESAAAQSGEGGMLGVHVAEISEENQVIYRMPAGVYVADVTEGSGAQAAGLAEGDIITQVDGRQTATVADLKAALSGTKAGDTVEVTFVRPDADRAYDGSSAQQVQVVLQ